MSGTITSAITTYNLFISVLCPALSHLPSQLQEQVSPFLLRLILHPVHLTMPHQQHQKGIYFECNKKSVLIQME